jgi:hypothetical protein
MSTFIDDYAGTPPRLKRATAWDSILGVGISNDLSEMRLGAMQWGCLGSIPVALAASDDRSSAAHEMKNDRNNRQNQENVNKKRRDVEYEETAEPQQEQNKSNTEKHLLPLFYRMRFTRFDRSLRFECALFSRPVSCGGEDRSLSACGLLLNFH